MLQEKPMLGSNAVRLRTPDRSDIPNFIKWFNDAEVTQFLARTLPMSEVEEIEWVDNLHKRQQTDLMWCIEIQGDAPNTFTPIGTIGLHGIHARDRRATLGIAIGEKDQWGKSYGRRAIDLLLLYAFHSLNLRKVELCVLANNPRGMRCYRACGFTEVGKQREQVFKNGVYHDEITMEVFRSDWIERP
ncbi:MAG: GNAT family protein [Patescibacteria group bacterium]